jgi:hypothetical protein
MRDFAPNDLEAAIAFDRGVTDPAARAIHDYLIAHPDERVDGPTLARTLGLPDNRLVARATYQMGQVAAAEGRKRPWSEAQLGYLMPAPIAELLTRARGDLVRGS